MFIVNEYYSRADIYQVLSVPLSKQKGAWNTGYREYNGAYYLFVGVGTPGRTKHDYDNYWISYEKLHWKSKNKRNLNSNDVKNLKSNDYPVLIFTRNDSNDVKFKFEGLGYAESCLYNSKENLVEFEWVIDRRDYSLDLSEVKNKNFYYSLEDENIEDYMNFLISEGVANTEVISLVKLRVGQGKFRDQLIEKYDCKCLLCEVKNKNLLRASHIKPWANCNSIERLESNNGFLLCCNHDALFDRHLITFDEKGDIVISNKLDKDDYKSLNLDRNLKIFINEDIEYYLLHHRKEFYFRNK